MEFLKACSTNVHVYNDIYATRYRTYSPQTHGEDARNEWLAIKRVTRDLRGQGVLCTSRKGVLICFHAHGNECSWETDVILPALEYKSEGVLSDVSLDFASERWQLLDLLLESIEHSISYTLSQEPGVIRIQPWTWLCSGDACRDASTEQLVIVIHTKLWPDRSLYLIPKISSANHASPSHAPIRTGKKVVVAPLGKLAYRRDDDELDLEAIALWKPYILHMLEAEGYFLGEDSNWTSLTLVDEPSQVFIWPSDLCIPQSLSTSRDAAPDWRRWFGGVEGGGSYVDPLKHAESCANLISDALNDLSNKEHADNVDEVGAGTATQQSIGLVPDSFLAGAVASPSFTARNNEQNTAAIGIYPTPPDAVPASLPVQVPMDNVVESTRSEDITAELLLDEEGHDIANAQGTSFETIRPDSAAGQHSFVTGHDDLFGDGGEVELGENEVGDADFSFFDEPDDEIMADEPASPSDVQIADDTKDSSTLETQEKAGPITKIVTETPIEIRTDACEDDIVKTGRDLPDVRQNIDESALTLPVPNVMPYNLLSIAKPLSPFGVKERLFPPPVPASLSQKQSGTPTPMRRESTFSPVLFKSGLSTVSRYGDIHFEILSSTHSIAPTISLPPHRKKSRLLRSALEDVRIHDDAADDSESEEDSYEDSPSESENELPPKLPWENRKRKRNADHFVAHATESTSISKLFTGNCHALQKNGLLDVNIPRLLDKLVQTISRSDDQYRYGLDSAPANLVLQPTPTESSEPVELWPSIQEAHQASDQDLAYISQIVGEQASTCLRTDNDLCSRMMQTATATLESVSRPLRFLERALQVCLPGSERLDTTKIAMTREPVNRQTSNTAKIPQGMPRLVARPDGMAPSPDLLVLPPPWVRLRRAADEWELLPICLPFWEILGLGPASGPKNVRAFCIFPSNPHLQCSIDSFMADLGTAYENCRLGSHIHKVKSDGPQIHGFEDGMVPVDLPSDASLRSALSAYAQTSVELGKALRTMKSLEADRSIVVYIFSPFSRAEALHHLCACFWLLFKAYSDGFSSSTSSSSAGTDILLQIVPISSFAATDKIVIPDTRQLALIAREVYDRCPPSASRSHDKASLLLPIPAFPSIELAAPAPKKIVFQLTTDPPNELMQEPSILHLAYSRSKDKKWLYAAWVDSTGHHQSDEAFCIRGRSLADTIQEIWDRTQDILAARQVTWRVFIVTNDMVDEPLLQHWLSVASKPRQYPMLVTFCSLQLEPLLALHPPMTAPDGSTVGVGGFDKFILTPATTPQAQSVAASPEIGKDINAPPTPAPSENAISSAENDPDAQLVDIADESWAVLLSTKLLTISTTNTLAAGVLFKQGGVGSTFAHRQLPSLGVCVHWTIQVRVGSNMLEGQSREAEMFLRELLKMYRNLAVLTKSRGLDFGQTRLMPIHMAIAFRGAAGLNGLL